MKRWRYWVGIGVVLVAVAALIGWAATYISPLTPSASEEWSRGRVLGSAPVNIRVDAQAAPDGGMFLSWVDSSDRLHVIRLGTQGQTVSNRTPSLWTDIPREPHLLVDPEGTIHLAWRETGEDRSLLTYAQLNDAIAVRVDPFFIMPGDETQSLDMAFNRYGEVEIFWAGQAGIYHVTLNAQGEIQGEPVLLVEGGEDISVQMDQGGTFHLTWLQKLGANEEAIYYASFDTEQDELSQPEEMTRLRLRPGQSVQSLDVGLDADTGNVLWIIQDSKTITSMAQYAFFPLEIPRQKRIRDIALDVGGNPLSLCAARGQYERLLVALTETIMTDDGPQLQIGVITLRGEQMSGDQVWMPTGSRVAGNLRLVDLRVGDFAHNSQFVQSDWPNGQVTVTASDHPSLRPNLVVDTQRNLHLTWLETAGFGVYRVAYASTASEVKEFYNRTTLWDMTDRALGLSMQLFTAVGLTPVLAIYWSLFPLGWLLLYLFFSGREHLTTFGTWAAFGISVLLEVASTYLIYPHKSRMPSALQWSAPLATAAAGLLLALLYLRKRDERPLFGTFFVFAIVHGVLQVICFVLVR